MKNKIWVFTLLSLLCFFITACADDLEITVLYDRLVDLQVGDPVQWDDQVIGRVEAVEITEDRRVGVELQIDEKHRQEVTDQCRFTLSEGSKGASIEMVCLDPAGDPLADGATVEGSSSLALLLERGGRKFQEWTQDFKQELERWQHGIDQLPEREWYERLERSIDELAREMQNAGEDTRRYLRREVLPALEDALQRLKERFQQQGRGEETAPLERKIEELKAGTAA